MTQAFRCPECGARSHVFEALNESLLAISGELSIEAVLGRIVDVARDLVHASYGALAVADGEGGFSNFIMSAGDESIHAVPPRVDGVLVAALSDPAAYSTPNVQEDPRFDGWPDGYPDLKSFLAVPIHSQGETVGAFYLANENVWGFTTEDQALVELLAPHAGLAIKNARLYEQSRELTVVQERNRLARELHDSVTQTLFSMKLAAETASALIEDNPEQARVEIAKLQELARQASSEMRSLVFELRPPELETEGLAATLHKHVEVLRRVHPMEIHLHVRGERTLQPRQERELFRIAQEALNNAIKHSQANAIVIEVGMDEDKLLIAVSDDGVGFDTALAPRPRHLGLVSMNERAQALGADFLISSGAGRGTLVTVELRQ